MNIEFGNLPPIQPTRRPQPSRLAESVGPPLDLPDPEVLAPTGVETQSDYGWQVTPHTPTILAQIAAISPQLAQRVRELFDDIGPDQPDAELVINATLFGDNGDIADPILVNLTLAAALEAAGSDSVRDLHVIIHLPTHAIADGQSKEMLKRLRAALEGDALSELTIEWIDNTSTLQFGMGNGARVIGTALATNTSLQRLNMSMSMAGDPGAQYLADGLRQNTSLEYIDLSGNCITGDGARALASAILDQV